MLKIDSLQRQTNSFRNDLAAYFWTMADFDKQKAKADHDFSMSVWAAERQAVKRMQVGRLKYTMAVCSRGESLTGGVCSFPMLEIFRNAMDSFFVLWNQIIFQNNLGPSLAKLFQYAFEAQEAELAERAIHVALAVASFAAPADAVFNPGEFASKASTLLEKTGDLLDAAADMKSLGYTFHQTLPKMKRLGKQQIKCCFLRMFTCLQRLHSLIPTQS